MKRVLLSICAVCLLLLGGCGDKQQSSEEVVKEGFEKNDGSKILEIYNQATEQEDVLKIEELIIQGFDHERNEVAKLTPEDMVLQENKYVDFIMLSDKDMQYTDSISKAAGIFKLDTEAVNGTISIPVDEACSHLYWVLEGRRNYRIAQDLLKEGKKTEAKERLEKARKSLNTSYNGQDVLAPIIEEQLVELK